MSNQRKNYLSSSKKTGAFNYRRGIPSRYRRYFLTADGHSRGFEWKESLKTKNKAKALTLAAAINLRFEQTLLLAKLEERKEIQEAQNKWEQTFLSAVKKYGLHPEQAPSILETKDVQKEWVKRHSDFIEMLREIQSEHIEVTGGVFDEVYKPKDGYYQIEEQINFLLGKRSDIIANRLRPTLGSAMEEYIEQKISWSTEIADAEQKQKLNRVRRVCNSFASFIGNGSIELGLKTQLSHIQRSQSRDWMKLQIEYHNKAGSSVGREITILSSIYNLAVTEDGKDDPELRSDYNPFGKLRSDAERIHDEQIRTGKRRKLSSRPWTPTETQMFTERLHLMNPQLKIIAKISILTGARLKDIAGLMTADIYLNDDDDSYLHYRHNQIRKVSKDSIERRVPLFGDLLTDLRSYTENLDPNYQSLFPRYCGSRQTNNVSAALNKKHLDLINQDPTFKIHGLRDTLSSKFMATNVPNDIAGYLIGWRNKTTVGMQHKYQRGGYPHDLMLDALITAHSVTSWGINN